MYGVEIERILLDLVSTDRVSDGVLGLEGVQPVQRLAVRQQLERVQDISWFPLQTHLAGDLCVVQADN